jgi:hypothetical protein
VGLLALGGLTERSAWTGSGADLYVPPILPLAGRLRRAQMFLRALGIEVTFSREGRAGTRMLGVSTSAEHTVSTVSSVRHQGSRSRSKQPHPQHGDQLGLGRRRKLEMQSAQRPARFELPRLSWAKRHVMPRSNNRFS